MFKITTKLDPKVKKWIDKLNNPTTKRRILSSIAIELKNSTRARFFFSKDPEDQRWIPSKAAIAENRRTLVKTGRLRDSVATNVIDDKIEIGIPESTIYGKKFQLGEEGQIKREFLGVSKEDEKIIIKIIRKELEI